MMPSGVYIRTEEAKRKISEALKGEKHPNYGKHSSEKTRRKMSEAHKGDKNSMYGKHHSEEAKKKLSKAMKGKRSNNWKGGITSESLRIRNNIESHLWREAVFARDNWICQKCGRRGGELEAHHIKNFAQYSDGRFDIENGIALCKNCHKEFHHKYGIKNNTKEQLEEFLEEG